MKLRVPAIVMTAVFASGLICSGGVAQAAGIYKPGPADAPRRSAPRRELRHKGLAIAENLFRYLGERLHIEFRGMDARHRLTAGGFQDDAGYAFAPLFATATQLGNSPIGEDVAMQDLREELLTVDVSLTSDQRPKPSHSRLRAALRKMRPTLSVSPRRVRLKIKARW